jgi:hypothetical protein
LPALVLRRRAISFAAVRMSSSISSVVRISYQMLPHQSVELPLGRDPSFLGMKKASSVPVVEAGEGAEGGVDLDA